MGLLQFDIKHPDTIQFAGDYNLSSIVLHNHANEGIEQKHKGVDIKALVQEFNIYESIYNNALTGSVVIVDATNLINKLPIQGTERLSFKLSTPGAHKAAHIVDCSEESGHPMHIYKLSNKKQLQQGTLLYTLHFCSREFLRNIRTRVSQAYSGTIDQAVRSIFADENYLDSKRVLNYQKTRNKDKIVIPSMHPFGAINMLAERALADDSRSAGYHFWQTTKGFHFRSWESLCVGDDGITPRPVKQIFRYMPMNITDPEIGMDKIQHDYQSVEEYKFINNFHDVAANTALGTYGQRMITHNMYDKSYKIDDYHYHKRFNETRHADKGKMNYAVVDTPVDWDTTPDGKRQRGVSDYPESRVSLQSTTQFSHEDGTGNFGIDVEQDGITEAARVAQANQVHAGTKLQMTVKGQSYLEAGDVIEFKLREVDDQNPEGKEDRQFSGRYIITKIRHRLSTDEYIQILECSKDSVKHGYSPYYGKHFPGTKPKNEQATFLDIKRHSYGHHG
jgi:hypothetical protein